MPFSGASRALVSISLAVLSALPAAAAPAGVEHPSAADFYVPTLPGLEQDPNHPIHIYAGHLLSDPSGDISTPSKQVLAHIYFVLLKARRTADKERLIIWFNGGPGCSSFDGLMMEIGPWRMNGQGGLKLIEGGWDEYAHVLYLDQPPGTGFSYASTDHLLHDLKDVSDHVNTFLSHFYNVFPELRNVDTYLAGESFAGQYIPYIADGLLKTTLINVPLKGIAIGNGWMDGRTQYPAYYEFGIKSGILQPGTDAEVRAKTVLDSCLSWINGTVKADAVPVNFPGCESLMGIISDTLIKHEGTTTTCMNVYDIRLMDSYPACGMNWPPDLNGVTNYLRRRDVVSALHATDKAEAWTECQGGVFEAMSVRNSPAAGTLLPGLLEKIPVMLFAGDQDYICNYVGVEAVVANLEWGGARGMGDTPMLPWSVNGTDAGWWQTSRGLTYVKVTGASHMVGFDVPIVAHDMMLRWMGVDLSLDGTLGLPARIPSVVGDNVRGGLTSNGTLAADTPSSTLVPEQDKARWEAYYNAGSAALIFVLIMLAIGLFFYFRSRRQPKPGRRIALNDRERQLEEETIPLSSSSHANGGREDDDDDQRRQRKGKDRRYDEGDAKGEPIFDVGDDASDDETEREFERQ